MPLSLSYFNLRSLNTSKELSRLVDTGEHMRGGRGNPPVSLSAENTDVISLLLNSSLSVFPPLLPLFLSRLQTLKK